MWLYAKSETSPIVLSPYWKHVRQTPKNLAFCRLSLDRLFFSDFSSPLPLKIFFFLWLLLFWRTSSLSTVGSCFFAISFTFGIVFSTCVLNRMKITSGKMNLYWNAMVTTSFFMRNTSQSVSMSSSLVCWSKWFIILKFEKNLIRIDEKWQALKSSLNCLKFIWKHYLKSKVWRIKNTLILVVEDLWNFSNLEYRIAWENTLLERNEIWPCCVSYSVECSRYQHKFKMLEILCTLRNVLCKDLEKLGLEPKVRKLIQNVQTVRSHVLWLPINPNSIRTRPTQSGRVRVQQHVRICEKCETLLIATHRVSTMKIDTNLILIHVFYLIRQ